MRVLLLLGTMMCAVQATDMLIEIVQEVNVGCGCNDCGGNGGSSLDNLQEQLDGLRASADELQGQVNDAQESADAVSGAGDTVADLIDAISGGNRRRHRRSASTVSLPSCETEGDTIEGDVEDIIIQVLEAIQDQLADIATSLDADKLNCYVDLASQLTAMLNDGTINRPDDPTAILTLAETVSNEADAAEAAVQTALQELNDALTEVNNQIEEVESNIEDAGGSVDDEQDVTTIAIEPLTTTVEPLTTTVEPLITTDFSAPEAEGVQAAMEFCALVVCEGPPDQDCVALENEFSCCPNWICNDLPTNCTSDDGTVYQVNDVWNEGCQTCRCYFSSFRGVYTYCYNTHYCPHKPHRDCLSLGEDEETCCEEYYCLNTTCKSDGRYYGIGDRWQLQSNPCENCECVSGENSTEILCSITDCRPGPAPHCRPITFVDQCCPHEWDCSNEYLITTPKKWIRGQDGSICVFTFPREGSLHINITFTLGTAFEVASTETLDETVAGGYNTCVNLTVPEDLKTEAIVAIYGQAGNASINEELSVTVASVRQTFIQTDKFLYLPGQIVNFRVLTIVGSAGLISYENLEEVWITSPGGSRIRQWTNVDNSMGLVQLQHPLADEVEEGEYKIWVKTEGEQTSQVFRVEEYVLPRFSVSLQPPPFVLKTDPEIVFRICAEYNYGQPVTGSVTLKVQQEVYYSIWNPPTVDEFLTVINKNFTGCTDISVNSSDIGSSYLPLKATASFTEDGTNIEMTTSASVKLHSYSIDYEKISSEEYYKPGLPFPIQVKASLPDGSPAVGELVSVCVDEGCLETTVDESGVVSAIIPPHLMEDVRTRIWVTQVNGTSESGPLGYVYVRTQYYYVDTYYSPSNSTLSLDLDKDAFVCHHEMDVVSVPVFFVARDTASALVSIQVVARSQMVWTSTEEYSLTAAVLPINPSHLLEPLQPLESGLVRGFFNVDIPLTPLSSPYLHILVWYARGNGEVVSASARVNIGKCLNNPTSLRFDASGTPPAPKDEATITISSSPNSVCGLGVVDRSVEALSRGQPGKLSVAAIFMALSNAETQPWQYSQVNDHDYCYSSGGYGGGNGFEIPVFGPVFQKKRSIPYYGSHGSDYVDALKAFDESGLLVVSDLTLETRPCNPLNVFYPIHDYNPGINFAEYDELRPVAAVPAAPGAPGAPEVAFDIPESAADGGDVADDTEGEPGERTYFPETWLWNLVVISEDGEAVESVQLPDTITEWVGEAVCAHSTYGVGISNLATITTFTPFFLDLALPPTARRGESVPVLVSVFNYYGQNLPVTIGLAESSEYTASAYEMEICVLEDEKSVVEFVVTPSEVGSINLTFSAVINTMDETCGGAIEIEKSDVVIRPLTVKFDGIMVERTFSNYMCAGESPVSWFIETPEGIVEDSERVFVSVSADLLGPTLENLGHLIRMPYGCGEQNMLNFAPNIFILQYLEASGQLTLALEETLVNYMVSGYQRELTYRHNDGSYSAFGNNDPEGSTWLTAFVLKSFAQAAEYITVDEEDLEVSTDWLLSLQDNDGCFMSVGVVLHKAMKGGISELGNSLVPLTSYVIISLLEAGQVEQTTIITSAVNCILTNSTTHTYTNSLKAYALALANETAEAHALIGTVDHEIMTGSSGLPDAVLVEAAGYLLLAMLKADPVGYAGEAITLVKFISSLRNGQGGFVSTQDTVVALQALAEFSRAFPPSDANLNLTVSAGAETLEYFVTPENSLVLQTQYVTESTPYDATLSSEGEGCALVMIVQRYNIPERTEIAAFNMSVIIDTEDCSASTSLMVCASYLDEDEESNMAVFDFELETGYSAVTDDLQTLEDNGIIKRFEEDDENVILYLQSLTASETCVSFNIIKDFEVINPHHGTVTLYDYYEPEDTITKEIPTSNNECR